MSPVERLKSSLHQSFVAPFAVRSRAIVYAGQFMGAVGFSFLAIFTSLDIVRAGAEGVSVFMITRFGWAGLVIFPLLTFVYLRGSKTGFSLLALGVQLLSALMLFLPPELAHDPMLFGLAMGTAAGGYWMSYHLAMMAQTSDRGRAQEISLAMIIMTAGGILGTLMGGYAASKIMGPIAALLGLLLQLTASGIYCYFAPTRAVTDAAGHGQVHVGKFRRELFADPNRTILTLIEAGFIALSEFLRPVWLTLIGIGAMSVGIMSAAIVLLQACLAPLAARLYGQDRSQEIRLGSCSYALAWLPWLLTSQKIMLFFSVPFWSAGLILVSTGMNGRWYRDRSVMAVLAREILLTFSRIVAFVVVVPLLFQRPEQFPLLPCGLAMLLFLSTKGLLRKAKA
jgi:hypothetical protein